MTFKLKEIDKDELQRLAWEYIEHCLESKKQVATASGVKDIKERHLPTIRYFLYIWLRLKHFDFYTKSNWYEAMGKPEHPLSDTIKNIDETFNALATDIVANEAKGIFYAKNKLGMTDRMQEDGTKKMIIEFIEVDERSNTNTIN